MHIELYRIGEREDLDHDSWPMRLKQLSVCEHLSERQLVSGGKTFKRCQ